MTYVYVFLCGQAVYASSVIRAEYRSFSFFFFSPPPTQSSVYVSAIDVHFRRRFFLLFYRDLRYPARLRLICLSGRCLFPPHTHTL